MQLFSLCKIVNVHNFTKQLSEVSVAREVWLHLDLMPRGDPVSSVQKICREVNRSRNPPRSPKEQQNLQQDKEAPSNESRIVAVYKCRVPASPS